MEALSVNQLSQEFLDYQLIDNAENPDSVQTEATVKVKKNANNYLKKQFYRMDVYGNTYEN